MYTVFSPTVDVKEQLGYYRPGLSPRGKELYMSNYNENTLRNIGLQFFADGGDGAGGSEGGQDGNEGSGGGKGTGNQSGKTFTQEDVNALLKKEKESAKKALLKELGVEDAKSAKDGLAKYKEILDKDKSAAEKAGETLAAEQKAKAEAEKRALLAEAKVEVLSAGCKPEYLDDVITLAMTKVSNDKDLAAVVKGMKEDTKYSAFFGEGGSDSGDKGTGGGAGFKRKEGSDKKGGLGSRLGAQAVNNTTKNPYFNN